MNQERDKDSFPVVIITVIIENTVTVTRQEI
jgi:hypothetical protein